MSDQILPVSVCQSLVLSPDEIADKANIYMNINFPNSMDIGWSDGEDAYIAAYTQCLKDLGLI